MFEVENVSDIDDDGGVGRVSNTMAALQNLPTHVGGAYTVEGAGQVEEAADLDADT